MNSCARSWRVWLLTMTTTALAGALVDPGYSSSAVQRALVAEANGLYADDPNHLWNRVHRQFHVRVADNGEQDGLDEVDPLLWRETRYLLTEPSHSQAIRLLDEFLKARGERLITDPVKRAVFQHDLWAIFDWLAGGAEGHPDARKALIPRVARLIRRVALTRDQIQQLPDNYAAAVASQMFADRFDPKDRSRAFLPRDIFLAGGPWVVIGGEKPVARQHAGALSHSAFSVIWRVPGGETATLAYLKKLWDFPTPYIVDPFVTDGERRVMVNPELPPVPYGTHIALVRRMLLVDRLGTIVPSTLTENLQLRVLFERDQHFFEFRMRRRSLFGGKAGGLQAVGPEDRAYFTFSSQGIDLFERYPGGGQQPPEILKGCPTCHSAYMPPIPYRIGPTIPSLQQLLKPHALVDSRHPRWDRWFSQAQVAATEKKRRADWGLLQGFWQSNPW